MEGFLEGVKNFFKINFLPPKRMNWGYPVFLMSVGLITSHLLRLVVFRADVPFSPTSLVFNALYVPFLTLISLIIPAVALSSTDRKLTASGICGEFTGVGPLILGLVSGIPLSLVYSSCHNFSSYLLLRFGGKMVFPEYMCYNTDPSKMTTLLEILTQNAIPAIGLCLFFTGLLYTVLSGSNKILGTAVIVVLFGLYSLNLVDLPGTILTGLWLIILRDRTGNIFAPFLALLAKAGTDIAITSILSKVDITTLQTYSDIHSTVFYCSVPAIFVAFILFALLKSSLDDFDFTYKSDLLGRTEEEDPEEKKQNGEPFFKGLNPALITGLMIIIVLWVLLITA
ncbi:MAG: CPBP family intramembrane metalloprotease [Clostridiales bacterium]|nr:CPBP family intramembrane metalloprotease [Clostridiales bacterium]